VLMENGINGFVPLKLTDLKVDEVMERYPEGSMLQARVTKIDIQRFNVELTCKDLDLKDERNMYRVQKDAYYDYELEASDEQKLREEEEKEKARAQRTPYVNRVIFHPNFKNINFEQTCLLEPSMQPGDVIIRPSSKGSDHLTLSWKVDSGIMTHIDVLEKEKSAPYALGKKLYIRQEEYDDLDEIVARYVQPLSSYLNELLGHKNYRDSKGGNKELLTDILRHDKEAQPERIPYFFSASKSHPGYFFLAYMPNQRPHFEYLSITLEGYKFRRLVFPTLDRLLMWFKENYNDPTYMQAQSARLPPASRTHTHGHKGTPISPGRQRMANSPSKYRHKDGDGDVEYRTPNTYGAMAREYASRLKQTPA
ncbi:Transcription elongation factor SPT6, partial [Cichlidogyrus casuarinus]